MIIGLPGRDSELDDFAQQLAIAAAGVAVGLDQLVRTDDVQPCSLGGGDTNRLRTRRRDFEKTRERAVGNG